MSDNTTNAPVQPVSGPAAAPPSNLGTSFIGGVKNPSLVRSSLILPSERFILESSVMGKLESGSGLLGISRINLE